MCQAITEVASAAALSLDAVEFHALNRCLDVAIASAVTTFQAHRDAESARSSLDPGALRIEEMRSALGSATAAAQALLSGNVGVGGSTAQVLRGNLQRLEELLARATPAPAA